MKASIAKHFECSEMGLHFSYYFILSHLTGSIIMNMLHNVNNRLMKINGNEDFIIIRRISDNKIFMSMV